MGSIPTLGKAAWFTFEAKAIASVYSAANEYQHCTCDGLASCSGESVQLHSKLLALNETRFKHWPSLAFSRSNGMVIETVYETVSVRVFQTNNNNNISLHDLPKSLSGDEFTF